MWDSAGGNVSRFGPKASLFPSNTLAGGAAWGRNGVDTSSATTGTAVECGTGDPIADDQSFTMMFAGTLNALPGTSDWSQFITKRDTFATGNMRWSWYINDDSGVDANKILLNAFSDTLVFSVPSTGYHVWILTYDGTTGRLYEDGPEVATDTASFSFESDTAAGLRLGNEQTDATENFDGVMDVAALWDRPLTASEAAILGVDPYILFRPPHHLLPAFSPAARPKPRILVRSP
jgi:hypothetical protein